MKGVSNVAVGSIASALLGAAGFLVMDGLIPRTAEAAPVYLLCQMPKSGEPVWELTLDEQAGTASVYFPQAKKSKKEDATYTREEVRWGGPVGGFESLGGSPYTEFTVVNRSTGELVHGINGLGTSDNRGFCEIQDAPKQRIF